MEYRDIDTDSDSVERGGFSAVLARAWSRIVRSRRAGYAALAAIVVLLAIILFAAAGSAPGGALYSTKVNVLEPLISATKLTDASRTAYRVTRAERRLGELKALHARDMLTDEQAGLIARELETQLRGFAPRVGEDTRLAPSFALEQTVAFASIMRAAELVVSIDPDRTDVLEQFTEFRLEANDLRNTAIGSFVRATEDPVVLQTFISSQLAYFAREIDSGRLSASLIEDTRKRIEEIAIMLSMDDIAGAVETAVYARQDIMEASHLSDVSA